MRLRNAIVGLFGLLAATAAHAGAPAPLVSNGDFDFYVLTLSWSPGFCDTGGDEKSSDQCAVGSGQGFVVHGLWPDNQRGRDPQDCGGDDNVSAEALAQTRGVYPNAGLARYEYRKHGTCTGLGAENYFAAVKYARDQFVIPDMLKAPRERISTSPADIASAFMAVNAHLGADNMAITCARGELVDVRFCISKTLGAFVNCPSVAGHTCRSSSISVAPPR
jgi:ribonuclease T2